MVQLLGLGTLTAKGPGSVHDHGPHKPCSMAKKKKKKKIPKND